MKWEYLTLVLPATGFFVGGNIDAEKLTTRLNQLGALGWELVSTTSTNMTDGKTRDLIAILKRPAQ